MPTPTTDEKWVFIDVSTLGLYFNFEELTKFN